MPSKRDILILIGMFAFGAILSGVVVWILKPNKSIDYTQENIYKRAQDSLAVLRTLDRDTIAIYRKHIFYTDSLVLSNFKIKKQTDANIKNFTPSGRQRYMDSLFKSSNVE